MAAVVLVPAEINRVTGSALTSDTTTLVGSVATRTLVFDITSATFQSRFPATGDQAAPFRDLYTYQLANALKCFVTADAPVIA